MQKFLQSETGQIFLIFATGPIIPIISYNLVSLIYNRELSSTPIYGYLITGALAAIPFLVPFFFRTNEGDISGPPVDGRRLLRSKISYITATVLTIVVFGWSALAEEGPYLGGGAAMSLVAVIFFGIPGTLFLTCFAAFVSGFFYKGK